MSLSVGWLLHGHILDTGESNVWGAPRFITFLVVVAVHLAALALLMMESRIRTPAGWADDSVELIYFPPTKVSRVRFQDARLQRLTADTAISATLPGVTAPSLSAPASGTEGDGSAVNWAAEAHRAVQAFEIRRNHPASVDISSSPSWTDWWPREHRAGERFKTDSGDWIVWISGSCYQLATAGSGAIGSGPSRIFCPGHRKTAQDEQSPASKKLPRPEG